MNIKKAWNETYWRIENEAAEYKTASGNKKPNLRVYTVACIAAVSLVFIEYIGKNPGYTLLVNFLNSIGLKSVSFSLLNYLETSGNIQLHQLAFWISVIVVFYLILPMVLIKVVFREKLRDYGLCFGNLRKDYGIYVVMLIIMLPLVYMVSTTHSFQLRYPFYTLKAGEGLYPNFWIWQCLYFVQFIGVEFFFRGFMVHGTKKQLGFYSIVFMVIPYCMIHFGKPMAESIAAIVAGIALGFFSLKSKSIIPGVLIHYSVAIAMDFAALYQKGYF